MPEWSCRWSEDDGTATLEFITAGLILLLPLVYLVLSMAAIQGGRSPWRAPPGRRCGCSCRRPTLRQATAQAEQAVRFALADYGLDADDADPRSPCRIRTNA